MCTADTGTKIISEKTDKTWLPFESDLNVGKRGLFLFSFLIDFIFRFTEKLKGKDHFHILPVPIYAQPSPLSVFHTS